MLTAETLEVSLDAICDRLTYLVNESLSVLSKVFECVVFERLYKFMQVYNLFYRRQFGLDEK